MFGSTLNHEEVDIFLQKDGYCRLEPKRCSNIYDHRVSERHNLLLSKCTFSVQQNIAPLQRSKSIN